MATPLRRSALAPLRAPSWRALLEGIAGYGLCLLLATLLNTGNPESQNLPSIVVGLFGLFWLATWPAWRMRITRGRWGLVRLLLGIPRALLCSYLLGFAALAVAALIWRPALDFLQHATLFPGGSGSVPIALLFLLTRVLVVLTSTLRRYLRVRLRRQLMGSHVAVVLATFVTMTFFSSLVVFNLVLQGFQPNAPQMAQSVAHLLRVNHSVQPLRRTQALSVLQQVETGSLEVSGRPPLASFGHDQYRPNAIWLIRPGGKLLVTVNRGVATPGTSRSWNDLQARYPHEIQTLRLAALNQASESIPLQSAGTSGTLQPVLTETPIINQQGHLSAILFLEVSQPSLSSLRLLQGSLALFGAATLILILATSIPVTIISFVFAYLLARGLTRHLEAVSQVATSIATGDLSARAPVQARNEIGRLAATVNGMAEHLEATVSELREARTQAVEALRARQVLVASISHELRTPLAIVHAHLERLLEHRPVLARGAPSGMASNDEIPVSSATLTALQSETERLAALVEDLFALSRAETGALQVCNGEIDVAALVDEVAALMRPLAHQEGHIALSVQAAPGLPHATADPDRLRQILANLVRNAVRHTPDGGIIVLSVSAEDRWLVIGVADTGEGIPASHLPHIFEPFYRVDEARSRNSGGAGLGLALVRQFVQAMGGRVAVESVLSEGSCFRVFLPVREQPPKSVG